MSFLSKYLQNLSGKIKDLVINSEDIPEEIQEYENQLIELLEMFFNFIDHTSNSSFYKKNLFFINEILELLIYSDNMKLIIQIIFYCERSLTNIRTHGEISKLSSPSNKYILPCLERFFFYHKCNNPSDKGSSKTNPYYGKFMKFEEFREIKNHFEKCLDSKMHYSYQQPEKEEDHDGFFGKIKVKKNKEFEEETIEINNFNYVYGKKSSYKILVEILKEKNTEHLQNHFSEEYVDLLYKIKFLKIGDEHQKSIYFLIIQLFLKSLIKDRSALFGSNLDYEIPSFENYFLIFFLGSPNFVQDPFILKYLYRGYNSIKLLSMEVLTEDKSFVFSEFSRKVSDNAQEILKIFPNDLDLIYQINDFVLMLEEYHDKQGGKKEALKNIFPFIKKCFQKICSQKEDNLLKIMRNDYKKLIFLNSMRTSSHYDFDFKDGFLENINEKVFEILNFILNEEKRFHCH